MEQNAAAEHLEIIRTLMERAALYRRALAPVMLYIGVVGVAAGAGGVVLGVDGWRAFYAWWFGAAALALAGAFVIARRQALQDREPFWSPPTLRVAHAIAPPLAAGAILAVALIVFEPAPPPGLFALSTALFYGCAVHAAGFFMPRGMKLFGWLFVGVATVASWGAHVAALHQSGRLLDHLLMGALFGVLQLAYGLYLSLTDSRKTAL